MTNDDDQLRLLSIFHYIVGGLAGFSALMPAVYLLFGLFFIFSPGKFANAGAPPPAFIGWILIILGAIFITLGLLVAGLIVTAGRFLSRRKHHLFCLVTAGVECAFMPFGTVLGVFTIVVLMRESVKQMFTAKP
jgi:hypothetical protein